MKLITTQTFDDMESYWRAPDSQLKWPHIFMLPPWLQMWWNQFGDKQEYELHICTVIKGNHLFGVAPLMIKGETAMLIGGEDVCDYSDVICAPGKASEFCRILLNHLRAQGIAYFDLKSLRPDSVAMRTLATEAQHQGGELFCEPIDTSSEIELPASWDAYLMQLNGKQRHEIRRKLRRLDEAGDIRFRVVRHVQEINRELDFFFDLFGSNRKDKADFMTRPMERFFRSLAEAMAHAGLLKLCFLDINNQPAASALCFDYDDTIYLYNSGYDRRYKHLGTGFLCKALSIKHSISANKKSYNFLKGAEPYKQRLGGQKISLYHCRIKI